VDDICEIVGTGIKHRVDVGAVVNHRFPTHQSFAAWRDADGGNCRPGALDTTGDLIEILIEIGLTRGGRCVDCSEGVLEFDDQVDAERFRDWCRPE
jgi:hypothetical protein